MTKHDSKTADELILDEKSGHHTHTYEHKGINLFAYFDKKISMWVIQNKHQSTVRFDDALDPPLYLRSLADITELAELRKKNAELRFANNEAKEYIESELGSVFITVCPSKPFNPKEHQAIRDLEQAQPKWISVDDELPNNHSYVLVSGHGGTQFISLFSRSKFYRQSASKKLNGVTHWMPLPQKPEVK